MEKEKSHLKFLGIYDGFNVYKHEIERPKDWKGWFFCVPAIYLEKDGKWRVEKGKKRTEVLEALAVA